MEKYYCKQVPPEHQEDNLFWRNKNNELCFEDDVYTENVIICGNNDYLGHYTKAYEKVLNMDDATYEYENHFNHWQNFSEIINYYFTKENGKKYSTKEIHKWKKLMDYWQDSEEDTLQALELITGKKWKQTCIKGCCQREWQNLYASEEITQEDIDYIEMCYFNTGTEWLVYESKEDFDNNDYAYSLYVDGYDAKENLAGELGCEEEDVVCLEFDGWNETPRYKEI